MAKYCKPYGLYVTYIDCMDCEGKECKQRNMKHMIETKLKPDQDIFYVMDVKVVRTKVNTIMIGASGISYLVDAGTVVAPKQNKGDKVPSCHIKEENVDTGKQGFVQCYPTFTTKEKCKEYLRS